MACIRIESHRTWEEARQIFKASRNFSGSSPSPSSRIASKNSRSVFEFSASRSTFRRCCVNCKAFVSTRRFPRLFSSLITSWISGSLGSSFTRYPLPLRNAQQIEVPGSSAVFVCGSMLPRRSTHKQQSFPHLFLVVFAIHLESLALATHFVPFASGVMARPTETPGGGGSISSNARFRLLTHL
jgi:hypothetical protein